MRPAILGLTESLTVKILIDVVYTTRPSVCSTSYLAWTLIEALINERDDVFFYVLYPPHRMEEEDWAFMNRFSDRVTLLPLQQTTTDRIAEGYMLRNDLRFYLNPWSAATWDADVVVSSRIPVLKHMRIHSSRQQGKACVSPRLYVGLDEMPILPFRDTVPWSDFMALDTLASYALADAVLINNQWTKKMLRPVARELLSPSLQKRVFDNLHEVVPVKLSRLNMKPTLYTGGKFEVAFVGRVTGTRNFGGVAELFRKSFSFPLGKNKQELQYRISTNSETMGAGEYGELDFIDLQRNNREGFYAFLNGAHVAVNLSTVEDFSLTTYETLLHGVPLIVQAQPWNEFLGPTYPFRVNNMVEAYALINALAGDYAGQYQRFIEWERTYWQDYVTGPLNITTSEKLIELITAFLVRRSTVMEHSLTAGSYFEQVQLIAQGQPDVIDLTDYIKKNGKMFSEVSPHFSLPTGRVPTTLLLKLCAEQLGYTDTNTTGVMRHV